MKNICVVLALALIGSSPVGFAVEIPSGQGSLSFEVLKDGVPVRGGSMPVNSLEGSFASGKDSFYPRMQCENQTTSLDSVQLFSGTRLTHKVVGKLLVLDVAQYDVQSPEAAIRALKNNECQNLAPRQTIVFIRSVRVPYEVPSGKTEVPLEGGYSLRYQVIPPSP